MALDSGDEDWGVTLRTTEQMLRDRDYTQIKPHFHGDEPVLVMTCKDAHGELTCVYLSKEPKVGVRTLRKIRQDSAEAGSKHIILISRDGLTPFASRELAENDVSGETEIFRKRELCFPVIRHSLVPRHEPLSKSQKAQLVSELGGRVSCLPKLKETDSVARYLHLTPGTVVKITRNIGSLEAEPYFRLVV